MKRGIYYLRYKQRLLGLTKLSKTLGKKPADGKTKLDEPTLFIDLFEAQNKMVDNFKNKCLESNIKWLLGFENYVNDKKRSKSNSHRYRNYSKGTIVFVDFFGNFGREYTYDHPAIVLKENGGLLVVAPITSNVNIYNDVDNYHIKLPAGISNLGNRRVNSTILLEQIRTISKNRVIKNQSFGRVSENKKLKEIDTAVIEYLAGFSFNSIKQEMKDFISNKDAEIDSLKAIIEEQKEEIARLNRKNF